MFSGFNRFDIAEAYLVAARIAQRQNVLQEKRCDTLYRLNLMRFRPGLHVAEALDGLCKCDDAALCPGAHGGRDADVENVRDDAAAVLRRWRREEKASMARWFSGPALRRLTR